jgi:hypothetical protein
VRVATRLAGMVLSDEEGRPQVLGQLWRDRPVVLVFIRHFG